MRILTMKMPDRYILLIVMLFVSVMNMSGYVFIEKKFIEQHDIDNETKGLKSDNPADFWISMVKNNGPYQRFLYDCQHKKVKKFITKYEARLPKFDLKDETLVLTDKQGEFNRIFLRLGLADSISCCIVNDMAFNSFSAYAPGKGYVVALSSGFINAPGVTEEMIVGMAAYESAHIYLSHTLQNLFVGGKNGGGNFGSMGAVGGLFGGIIGGAIGGGIEALLSNKSMKDDIPKGRNLSEYNIKYYREMVLEADLVAYRFMEWSGIGGDHYIKLLRLISANDPQGYLGDENSFYTCHQERIRFINYVKDHPEIGNKVNGKIMRKLSKKARRHAE